MPLFAVEQWGNVAAKTNPTFYFPIAFSKQVSGIIGDHYGITSVIVHFAANSLTEGSVQVSDTAGDNPVWSYYIAYGV